MAYATEVTISTGNKVSINYQTRDVSVSVTYQLEREDTDVVTVVREKTKELAQAHRAVWQTLHDAKVATVRETAPERPETVLGPHSAKAETANSSTQTTEPPSSQPSPGMEVPPTLSAPVPAISPGQIAALLLLLAEARWSEQRRRDYLRERFSCDRVDELNAEQAKEWLLELQRAEREASQQHRLENAHRNGSRNGTPT